MRIACLGDSCTFGQNVRADQAWPHLLWEMTGHDVRNLGVNGDTTRLALERFHRDVDLLEPDVVVVQFGHNDANLWDGAPRVGYPTFHANISELCWRTHRLGAKFLTLYPHEASEPKDREYRDRLRLYAQGALRKIDLLDDGYGVHPSPSGHRQIAERLVKYL